MKSLLAAVLLLTGCMAPCSRASWLFGAEDTIDCMAEACPKACKVEVHPYVLGRECRCP